MQTEDRYLKFVRWSDEDALYVGSCPNLFPWGGVCHAPMEDEAHRLLGELAREEADALTQAGQRLPEPAARPMREAVLA